MPRIAVYIRVSTDEQAEHGVSLDVQRDDCIQLAHELGDADPVVYCDDASGLSLNRPEIRKLLSELSQYTHLVVWTTDRLSRNLTDKLALTDELIRLGIDLVAVREPIDIVSAAGRMQYSVMGAVGEYESRRKSEFVVAAQSREAKRGRYIYGQVYGYRPGPDGIIQPDPAEAPIVREIYLRVARGETISAICRDLTTREIPRKRSRSSSIWPPTTISQMLRNRTYLGEVPWRGERYPGLHEPLIDGELWSRVQTIIAGRERVHGRKVATLSPLLRCGICGARIGCYTTTNGASSRYQYYGCTDRAQRPQSQRHDPLCITIGKLDAALWRHTELLLREGDLLDMLLSVDERLAEVARSRADLEARLRQIDEELTTNLRAARAGLITWPMLDGENSALMSERRDLERQLAEMRLLSDQSEATRGMRDIVLDDRVALGDALQLLRDEGTPEQQLPLLQALYARVDLYPPTAEPDADPETIAPASEGRRYRPDRRRGSVQNGGILHIWHHGLDRPILRVLPRYWSPARGAMTWGW